MTLPGLCNLLIKHINHELLDKEKLRNVLGKLKMLSQMYDILDLESHRKKAAYQDIIVCYRFLISKAIESEEKESVDYALIKECLNEIKDTLCQKVFENRQEYETFVKVMMRNNIKYQYLGNSSNKTIDEFNQFESFQMENLKEVQNAFCIEDYDHMKMVEEVSDMKSVKSPRFSREKNKSNFSEMLLSLIHI